MKIYVDPQADMDYSAYYIQGLYDIFGKDKIFFSGNYFSDLKLNRTFKFIVKNGTESTNYVIDWGDDYSIDSKDYEWSNHYGKINVLKDKIPPIYHSKLKVLPPSFGLKIWNSYESLLTGIANFSKVKHVIANKKAFFAKYYRQNQQLRINDYHYETAKANYVYSVNTLWNSDEWVNNDATVNQFRANFIRACQSFTNLTFEGGFIYSKIKNLNPNFHNLIIDQTWIPKELYIKNIKDSIFVFNTPAWASCHGWKLAEFLALGKAIISTPMINELEVPLEHGKNIHIVSGDMESIKEAIQFLIQNPTYRKGLEEEAYKYFQQYVSPSKVIKSLMKT